MNLKRLRAQLRESWTGTSPQFHLALMYAVGAAIGAAGTFLILTDAPFLFGGSISLPVLNVPSGVGRIPLSLFFVVCGPIGAVAGWRIGGFIHAFATSRPNLAAMLLFFAMLVPFVVGGAFFMLLLVMSAKSGDALFGAIGVTAVCAVWSVIYRWAIGNSQSQSKQPDSSETAASATMPAPPANELGTRPPINHD
jgi:hypothetical protein